MTSCMRPRSRGTLCRMHYARFAPHPILEVVAAMSTILSMMPPRELECLVRHGSQLKGDALLGLLAAHIEIPEAVSRFAGLAAALPADYTASQLAQCLLQLCEDMHNVVCSAENAHITRRGVFHPFGLGATLKKLGLATEAVPEGSNYVACFDVSRYHLIPNTDVLVATMAVCKAHPLTDPSQNMMFHMNQFRELLRALPEEWHTRDKARGCISPHLLRKHMFVAAYASSEPDLNVVLARNLAAYEPDQRNVLDTFPKDWSATSAAAWSGVLAWHISIWTRLMKHALTVKDAAVVFKSPRQLSCLRKLVMEYQNIHGFSPCLHRLAVMATKHQKPGAQSQRR